MTTGLRRYLTKKVQQANCRNTKKLRRKRSLFKKLIETKKNVNLKGFPFGECGAFVEGRKFLGTNKNSSAINRLIKPTGGKVGKNGRQADENAGKA